MSSGYLCFVITHQNVACTKLLTYAIVPPCAHAQAGAYGYSICVCVHVCVCVCVRVTGISVQAAKFTCVQVLPYV